MNSLNHVRVWLIGLLGGVERERLIAARDQLAKVTAQRDLHCRLVEDLLRQRREGRVKP